MPENCLLNYRELTRSLRNICLQRHPLQPQVTPPRRGDHTKAKEKLGWVPEITIEKMCAEMVNSDLDTARQYAILKSHGHHIPVSKD